MISQNIDHALQLLHTGECVAIPTETVYGLAADATRADAVAKIFSIKNRPSFDPLIVHIPNLSDVEKIATEFPPLAQKLAEKFWPGPLTLVLPKKNHIPDIVSSGLPTVGVRVPRHPLTQQLLQQFGKPLAAPSANKFGRISPTSPSAVQKELGKEVPLILDGGDCSVGLESTIVSFHEGKPTLLRLGGISLEEIESTVGPVVLANTPQAQPQAPGQIEQHYAPRKPLQLVQNFSDLERLKDPTRGALIWGDCPPDGFHTILNLSASSNDCEAASNFFQMLRALDESQANDLVAVLFSDIGLGRAINERLRRAAHR